MSFRNIHEYGELFSKYLEARKAIFLDRLAWNVFEADGMEFDQYDTPQCRWVILHEYGEVLGGVRLMPTTARFKVPPDGRFLQALLDYIMVSEDLLAADPRWTIWHPFEDPDCYADEALRRALLLASDHFPVALDIGL